MKTLVLGTIPNDYSPVTHRVLGAWCFIGKENVYPSWETLAFEPDPFLNIAELQKAVGILDEYAESLIPSLTIRLNELNNTSYSEKFWRIMIMPWLTTLVQTAYERQQRLLQFIKKHFMEKLKVEVVKNVASWNFKETTDFIYRGVLNPDYNRWLYSKMLENCCPDLWEMICIEEIEKNIQVVERNKIKEKINNKMKRKIKLFLSLILRCNGVYGMNVFVSSMFSILLTLKKSKNVSEYNRKINFDSSDKIKWLIDFEELIQETLPSSFLKIKQLLAIVPKTKKGKINLYGPEAMYFNEQNNAIAAYRVENGEQLILTQHGGNYGTLKCFSFVAKVEYAQSNFITWGWRGQENYRGNFLPMPSPYLSSLSHKRKRNNDNVIVVGTIHYLTSYRLDSFPQSIQHLSARNQLLNFFECLSEQIKTRVQYRPYPLEENALKDKNYFSEKFPDIPIVDGIFEDKLLHSRLIVLDHPVTTLNIALSANIPLIGFWDKNAWAMCYQAEPYFDMLENAGMIFQTGKEAAIKLNYIFEDIESWWEQPEIQKARISWCQQYARTNNNWLSEWIKALWKL